MAEPLPEPLPLTYPYRLICNTHGDIGRVAGPGPARDRARAHEAEHGEPGGYVMIWEDGTDDPEVCDG